MKVAQRPTEIVWRQSIPPEPWLAAFDKRLGAFPRPLPFLVCRLGASPADPGKGPISRPVGAVGNVPAPGVGSDRIDRLPNDIEGPGRIYFANHDGLGKMMIGVHHNLEAARCVDPLTVRGLPDRIYVGCARLNDGLRPHPEANEGSLHRIIRGYVSLLVEVRPHFHESVVLC